MFEDLPPHFSDDSEHPHIDWHQKDHVRDADPHRIPDLLINQDERNDNLEGSDHRHANKL